MATHLSGINYTKNDFLFHFKGEGLVPKQTGQKPKKQILTMYVYFVTKRIEKRFTILSKNTKTPPKKIRVTARNTFVHIANGFLFSISGENLVSKSKVQIQKINEGTW